MRLNFTFTDSTDLNSHARDDIFTTSFEIPDEAAHLIGYEERVLAIAQLVGHFTDAALHFSCSEMGIKNQLIKSESLGENRRYLSVETRVAALYFERLGAPLKSRQLTILLPVTSPLPPFYLNPPGRRNKRKTLSKNLISLGIDWCKTEQDFAYANGLQHLADQMLVLLSAEAALAFHKQWWTCVGFHPWWRDAGLINRHNKRISRQVKEERKREREEQKRAARAASQSLQSLTTTSTSAARTGAGRRPGAIPGIFKGVQFRSQLEIRFATELESRQIEWVYEAERLGEGNYLVDFFLPEYKCWVEVKGKFEPRDDYLLKDVAAYLRRERGERLLVYTQSKCFAVSETQFEEVPRVSFWDILLS